MKSKMKRRMLAIVLCMVIVLSNSSFIFASSESGTPAVEAASTEGTTSQTETDTQVTETTPQTLAVSESTPAPTDEPAAPTSVEVTPTPTDTPEVTTTPEPTGTPTPEATPTPTDTPETTTTPEPTDAPEITTTPELTDTPEATTTPEPTNTPEATPTPTQGPEDGTSDTAQPTATPTPTEAPVKSNEAVELKQEFKDSDGNVTSTVKAQIPEGTFAADASEITMEVQTPDTASAEHVKEMMEELLPENHMLGDYIFYDIQFKVNGTVTEPQKPITITFEGNELSVKDVKRANVFWLDPEDPQVDGDKDQLVEITQKSEMIENLQNSGQSTENIDDYDLSEITLKEDGISDKIQMEGRASTIYGCYVVYEPVQVLTYDDDQVTVTVSAAEEGIIPANAELKVVPITAEDKNTEDQYKEVEQKLQEKAEEDAYDIAGFLAYDITFVDEDGNETEPGGEVKVSIDYKEAAIPETISEEDAANAEVTVLHLEEDEKGEVKEVVDMAQDEKVDVLATTEENKVEKVEVRTDSFSTFTVIWTRDGNNDDYEIRLTSHYGYLENGQFREFPDHTYNGDRLPDDWQDGRGNDNEYEGGDYHLSDYAEKVEYGGKSYTYTTGYITKGENTSFSQDNRTDRISVNKESSHDRTNYYFYGYYNGDYYQVGRELSRDDTTYIDIYFVYEVVEELTTVETVDSARDGITMRMINMDGDAGQDYGNYRIWPSENPYQKINLGGGYNPGSIKQGLLEPVLGESGYPVTTGKNTHITNDNGNLETSRDGTSGQSLENLFSGGQEVNHLFRKDIHDSTGYYEYSSFQNYAYLDQETGNFIVYDQIGTPSNLGGSGNYFYQRGNFMPYNRIFADRKSTNKNLYNEYGKPLSSDNERYEEPLYLTSGTDYQFGMYMEANFIQPRNGIVQQTDDNMRFEFNGDDDLWIYIDNVLILDIGGVHDAHSGYIDFATGEVVIYDSVTSGRTQERRTTLYELFRQAKRMPDSTEIVNWDESKVNDYFAQEDDGTYKTFNSYSPHKIKMFYMERGRGASNLHMKFNLQVVPKGTVTVAKNLNDTDKEEYANENFKFELYIEKRASNWTEDKPEYTGQYIQVTRESITDPNINLTTELRQSNIPIKDGELQWSEDGKQFYLKPDQSVIFGGLKATQKYYVREVGIESSRYDEVIINTVKVTEGNEDGENKDTIYTDPEGISVVETSKKAVFQRYIVAFTNSCDENNSQELQITKEMKQGQLPDENDTFSFSIQLESRDGQLVPYEGAYYLTRYVDGVKEYYHYVDGVLTAYTDPDAKDLTCGVVTDGVVSGVPVGYTVAITGLLSGTSFKVQEVNIPSKYSSSPEIIIDKDTYTEVGKLPNSDGETIVGKDVSIRVVNSYAGSINVKKRWFVSNDVETDDEEIYVGLYHEDSPVEGKYLSLNIGNGFSGRFTALTDADYTKYSVKELRPVQGDETADFTIDVDGIPTGYIGIQEGTSITIDGIQFVVDYEDLSQDTVDTSQYKAVINNVQKWQIVKQSTSSENKLLGGAKFNLTWKGKDALDTNEGNDITYTGESQENTGIIKWTNLASQEFTGIFDDGYYILTEVEAPAGYSLGHEWEITITNGIPTAINEIDDQQRNPITIQTDDRGIITVYYKNTPIFDLPSAGSSGIFGYMMGGTLLLMAGTLILYKMKRKEVQGS